MPAVTDAVVSEYVDAGFVRAIPVLTPAEVRYYRAAVEKTCAAIGGRVTRIDGVHYFFQWAWDLATHARLLDAMETLLGPNILLKATRIFYKHARSTSFVGWHQDGITERVEDAQVPAVWLGLTDATAENGCLRVVPRSHRLGLVPHANVPDPDNLTSYGTTAQVEIEAPCDIVMKAGEMSLHHPLLLHASNANRTGEPRIGFSATYSATPLPASLTAVAWVRGNGPAHPNEAQPPRYRSLDDAVAAHRAAGHQILRGPT
ncbi:MAG TPA: phytanoyl-CoA dioxygenase family protein [Thermoanaerobaculia bacterium]|jgi:ectoine hydroxylase-related dioxygenase (phytanoyl-CoA dioxygenase family)